MEAKMNYIRKWQELPDIGITHYGVKFRGEKVSKREVSDDQQTLRFHSNWIQTESKRWIYVRLGKTNNLNVVFVRVEQLSSMVFAKKLKADIFLIAK